MDASKSFKEIIARNMPKVLLDEQYDPTEESEPFEMDGRYRVYEFFIYEDSCEPDWMDFLQSLHIQIYAIKHDRDTFTKDDPKRGVKIGDPKKVHWHVWLNFPGKKSGVTIAEICARCGGTRLQRKTSAIGSARYLIHMNEPDKPHYKSDEILTLGGSQNYVEYIMSDAGSLNDIVGDMVDYIYENELTNYGAFVRWCKKNNPVWFDVATAKRTLFFMSYFKSVTYELHQDQEKMLQDEIIDRARKKKKEEQKK